MLNKRANNRTPYIVLGALVLLAIIVRLASPPAPTPPGPLGALPNWRSLSQHGEMGPWSVNPSGTMWAGAWTLKTDDGKLRSAVWAIDLNREVANHYLLPDGSEVLGLGWTGNDSISVITNKGKRTQVIPFDIAKAQPGKAVALIEDATIGKVAAWPECSGRLVATLPAMNSANLGVLSPRGKMDGRMDGSGKAALLNPMPGDRFGRAGAISPDGDLFVISIAEDEVGGSQSFYLGNTVDRSVKNVFHSDQLPGKVEGMWVSPSGVLVMCSARDKFYEVVYDSTTGKLNEVGKNGFKTDMKKNWPDAPKNMMFVSYTAGYRFDLAKGKAKEIFDLDLQGEHSDHWRREVQEGRLYPRKDGAYTSVSFAAGAIDIRVLGKDGRKLRDILPRS